MGVAFDAKMTTGNDGSGTCASIGNATSITSNGMTVGGSATLLVGVINLGGISANISGLTMTWNGVSMTAGPTITSAADKQTATIFYLINPTTGNHALAAAWTNNADAYTSCVSFTGTDTSTGIQAADNQTTTNAAGPGAISVTIPTEATGATVAAYGGDGAPPTMTQTQIFSIAPIGPGGGASYAIGGTTSNVHQFTNSSGAERSVVGVHVLQPSGAAALTPNVNDTLDVGDRRFVIE